MFEILITKIVFVLQGLPINLLFYLIFNSVPIFNKLDISYINQIIMHSKHLVSVIEPFVV